jgi:hypothetical protein
MVSVRLTSAAFVEPYAASPGAGNTPSIEATFTIAPPPRSAIRSATARAANSGARRFVVVEHSGLVVHELPGARRSQALHELRKRGACQLGDVPEVAAAGAIAGVLLLQEHDLEIGVRALEVIRGREA